MALNRRSGQRFEANIWPGFVDAMTALLLVLVFVLSIFMIVQFMLRETISSQGSELDNLNLEVASLVDALGLERDRTESLTTQADDLNAVIDQQADEALRQSALIAQLQVETQEQAGRIGSFEEQVAGLLATQNDLQSKIATLDQEKSSLEQNVTDLTQDKSNAESEINTLVARISDIEAGLAREISEKEAAQIALAQARDEIDVSTEQARLAAARRQALEALIADLERETSDQSSRLVALETLTSDQRAQLEENATRLSEAEQTRLADAAAAEALRNRLEDADAEITAMALSLDAKRQEAEETLTLLAAARAAEDGLNDRLIALLADTNAAQAQAEQTQTSLTARLASETQARQEAEQRVTLLLEQLQAAQGDAATLEELRAELERQTDDAAARQSALEQARSEADEKARVLLEQLRQVQTNSNVETTSLRQELAEALAAQNQARRDASDALTAVEQRQLLLSTAEQELANEREASAKSIRQIEALNLQVAQLRAQLGGLQELLDASGARDAEADVQIQALGQKLNVALAQVAAEQKRVAEEQKRVAEEQRKAAIEAERRAELEEAERLRLEAEANELKSYRSEFFGQLRDLLGDQDGIRIAGDRFVFSSEVLFTPGSSDLSLEGQGEIAKVANILQRIARDIPAGLDWVIRVDGHTDNVPLSGFGQFADNWELSQARALSVVRLLSDGFGIPPERLSANGFGEFQPVAFEDTDEARALNRRIELKLTEK